MMGKKKEAAAYKTIAAVLLVIFLAVMTVVIYQSRKADGAEVYQAEGRYTIGLNKDGTFYFYDTADSRLNPGSSKDVYRWEEDMLVLEFENPAGVLYFQKEGDTLVFQKNCSVFPENIHLLDKSIFIKMDL